MPVKSRNRSFVYVIAGILAASGAVVVIAFVRVNQVERDAMARAEQVRDQRLAELERMRLAAASAKSTDASLPDELATLAADPTLRRPTTTRTEDELEESVYDIAGFEHAELQRVKGHPEAWSWLLLGPGDVKAEDFAPAGAVRDLLADSPSSIGGYPIHGLLYHVDAGPLRGSVVVRSPRSALTPRGGFQVATIAFHQQSTSMIIGDLCDLGLVPGVPAHASSSFKDECFAQVSKLLHKPEKTLFPSPWMLHDSGDKACNRSISGTLESAPGFRYECSWSAKTRKTNADVKRVK